MGTAMNEAYQGVNEEALRLAVEDLQRAVMRDAIALLASKELGVTFR